MGVLLLNVDSTVRDKALKVLNILIRDAVIR